MEIRVKLLTLVTLILGALPSLAQEVARVIPQPSTPTATAGLSFGQRMHTELARATNNQTFCYSPYGVHQVLNKLALIASPEARAQIERAIGNMPLANLPQAVPTAGPTLRKLDLLAQENDGYGVKVSQLSTELTARGLSNGDLIFRIDRQVIRNLNDFQQALQQSTYRDVELAGYSVKSGEAFVGLRVPVILQAKTRESSEATSKTALMFDPALAENANAFFSSLPATPDVKIFPLSKLDNNELTSFLGPGSQPFRLDRERRDALAILNVVRIDGRWQYPFEAETVDMYHGVAAEHRIVFMARVAALEYMRNRDFEQVILPIRDLKLRMRMAMPLNDKFQQAQASFFAKQTAWEVYEPQSLLKLQVPRFDIRFQIGVLSLLEQLGVRALVEPGSRFPGLSRINPFSLTAFDQHTGVSFHAKGVQATAQTSAVVSGMGEVSGARSLVFNRPFLFSIEDNAGTILIAGQHVDPLVENPRQP